MNFYYEASGRGHMSNLGKVQVWYIKHMISQLGYQNSFPKDLRILHTSFLWLNVQAISIQFIFYHFAQLDGLHFNREFDCKHSALPRLCLFFGFVWFSFWLRLIFFAEFVNFFCSHWIQNEFKLQKIDLQMWSSDFQNDKPTRRVHCSASARLD